MPMPVTILVCIKERTAGKTSCAGRGAEALMAELERLTAVKKLGIEVEPLRCFGRCEEGANVRIAPGGAFFHHVTTEDLPAILDAAVAWKTFKEAPPGGAPPPLEKSIPPAPGS